MFHLYKSIGDDVKPAKTKTFSKKNQSKPTNVKPLKSPPRKNQPINKFEKKVVPMAIIDNISEISEFASTIAGGEKEIIPETNNYFEDEDFDKTESIKKPAIEETDEKLSTSIDIESRTKTANLEESFHQIEQSQVEESQNTNYEVSQNSSSSLSHEICFSNQSETNFNTYSNHSLKFREVEKFSNTNKSLEITSFKQEISYEDRNSFLPSHNYNAPSNENRKRKANFLNAQIVDEIQPDSDNILELLISQIVSLGKARKERKRMKMSVSIINTAHEQINSFLNSWSESVDDSCRNIEARVNTASLKALTTSLYSDILQEAKEIETEFIDEEKTYTALENGIQAFKSTHSLLISELRDDSKKFKKCLKDCKLKWKSQAEKKMTLTNKSSMNQPRANPQLKKLLQDF